jgi:selenide,water dikinase
VIPDPAKGLVMPAPVRLTQFAAGGGCACKIPAAQLEELVAGLPPATHPDLIVGVETGDDAAVVRIAGGQAIISTADFFTPVVDSAYDWGRIAAANALSDVYAMGGTPVLAINLLGWPVDRIDPALIPEVLRGGAAVAAEAGIAIAGGHSITSPEPIYGLAVTGIGDPNRLLRNDTAQAGLPISVTKPLGVGILGNRHKQTGEVFAQAIASMTMLNAAASAAALAAGIVAATDVTGFGLLGHLYKLCRASGVSARIDMAAVPVLDEVRASLAQGYVPGGSRRNLDWVRPHLHVGAGVEEDDLLILADAQTSGGLLVIGTLRGAPVIGHTLPTPLLATPSLTVERAL